MVQKTKPPKPLTERQRAKFLLALAQGWSVTKAAKAGGIPRQTAYNWREADEAFARAWDDAIEAGTDMLEDVAIKRAKAKSDTLLIFSLKARRPEKFKDRSAVEVDLTAGLGARMEAGAKRSGK